MRFSDWSFAYWLERWPVLVHVHFARPDDFTGCLRSDLQAAHGRTITLV